MNEKVYIKAKECTIEIYDEFRNEQNFTVKQSVAATFEESIFSMKKNKVEYASVFLNLALISLKHGFMPNYILNRIEKIKKQPLKNLSPDEISQYNEDLTEIDNLLSQGDFDIDKDDIYLLRISMLLGE
ncbi:MULTISPECIES: hypothetical protein [Bacillus cereus group]|uniref:PRD domain-containing protein n=1 Tax=Bacillus proteolyticus TaxID=2026192 RepID=A0ABV3IFA6_9BACI|nr:hypothetical protein [Bacillus cereus group sp. N8]MBJ8107584.1 hypothetical protein [Bacillus cereus group sp. N8]